MGEVYRATDLNLHRDVAIKILPAQVAQDPDRLSRFRREAHLLAALNHPNIAAIYGLEEADGHPFLALELVEGEDISERLKHGAVPVDEALAIALQVAEALEEAHNKGIVHRDLKPANVKLTPDGKVKVLDFGLAKAWAGGATDGSSASAEVSQSPTLAFTGTVAGVILGTAAYMSPEQARGKPVDKRSDVWAFGVLLWEMLVGRKLFTGDTITDIIAAVVTREPDLAALPKATPPAVRRLVARCLQKDPRRRLPDMGTARLELQDVLSGVAGAESAPAATDDSVMRVARAARTRERWAWAVLALTLAGLAGYLVVQRLGTVPEKPGRRALPGRHAGEPELFRTFRISSPCRPTVATWFSSRLRPMARDACGFGRSTLSKLARSPAPMKPARRSGLQTARRLRSSRPANSGSLRSLEAASSASARSREPGRREAHGTTTERSFFRPEPARRRCTRFLPRVARRLRSPRSISRGVRRGTGGPSFCLEAARFFSR